MNDPTTPADLASDFIAKVRAARSSNGSPIGAIVMELGLPGSNTAETAEVKNLGGAVDPTAHDAVKQAAYEAKAQAEREEAASNFGSTIVSLIAERVAEAQSEQAYKEAENDASEYYLVAQTLTTLAAGAEALADTLELKGMSDVADFVRDAASKARKGARVARENAQDVFSDFFADAGEVDAAA